MLRTWNRRAARLAALAPLIASVGCGAEDPKPGTTKDPGALIQVRMESRVGVLLDEIPDAQRDAAAEAMLAQPASFWEDRARRQIALTTYRLVFRNFYYDDKGQLPLPPADRWTVTLDAAGASRVEVDGHDVVAVPYVLTGTLLSDADSPAQSEPALATAGGTWDEPFVLPIDPELLLQRTGYACMDEEEFPPNSVDGENVATFYDHECTVAPPDCHITEQPKEDCVEALKAHVGSVETQVHFERVKWDAALADAARSGEVTHKDAADLAVIGEGLDNHRVIWRYVPPDSCAIAEGCVGGPGWRRLLQFDASVRNLGAQALDIGDIDYFLEGSGTTLSSHNIYEFSACHQHYHFSHYGDFLFGDGGEQTGSKKAFCLQSTSRYSNNESSPLVHPYGSCAYQGIQAGWGDDYGAGLDCQWVDVTEVDTSKGAVKAPLRFVANPDQFLCEGTPILDGEGHPTFTPTDFKTPKGEPVDRIACDFTSDWDVNNEQARDVTLSDDGSLTTSECTRGQIGPLRDCGFSRQKDAESTISCTPGEMIELACSVAVPSRPQVLRVCEYSEALGAGVPCTYRDALANTLVGDEVKVKLRCPAARDMIEKGGIVALFAAPLLPGGEAQAISCKAP